MHFLFLSSRTKPTEHSLLRFSVWMGALFTVLGVSWGLAIQSGIVLFDGIYSGFSIFLSILSLVALSIIHRTDDDSFQFGRMAFEPLVVALKSIVILGLCVYAFVTSGIQILNGGWVSTSSVLGMLYAAISIAACLFSWLFLRIQGKDMPSLVHAESEQWLMDTVFSSIVLVSFLVSYLLSFTRLDFVVPYIDPGMVLFASLFFVRVPLFRFISSMREILMMAPPVDLQKQITSKIDAIAQAHLFDGALVRSAKIGRELAIDIAFIIPEHDGKVAVEELDTIRSEVKRSVSELGYSLWLNILFTKNRQWT